MESQEEKQGLPSQGGEGTASFQKILEKLEHIRASVGSHARAQGCAGEDRKVSAGRRHHRLIHGMPRRERGTCTALGAQHRLQNPTGPKFKSRLHY